MTSHSVASGCGGTVTIGIVVVGATVEVVVAATVVVVSSIVVDVVVVSTGATLISSHVTTSPGRNEWFGKVYVTS